jgi:putative membrane protein
MMKVDHFFTQDENQRISAAIKGVESRTDGEVAVMVVDQSAPYIEAEFLGGMILGSLLALILTEILVDFFGHDSLWYYIPLSFIFFFPFRWLCAQVPGIKTVFMSVKRKDEMVRQRALRAFYEKGLYKTRHHTGVLFFLSLLERKVWVLADKGIHKKINQDTLNQFARMVSQGIKEDRAGQALCQAIEGMGQLLAEHFPVTPGHVDELPDQVMTE